MVAMVNKETSYPFLNSVWWSPRKLLNEIINAPDSKLAVHQLAPQVLYSLVAQVGLSGAIEILELASREQLSAVIDFHVWKKDEIDIDRINEILELTDATDSLDLLGRISKSIDLKIVALLIARYVEVISLDEPSETPIAEGYITPDLGYTWLKISEDNAELRFNIARLLGYIYESNIELFYQLLAIAGLHTGTVLEEESYIDRIKRLQELGFPDEETALNICTPLLPHDYCVSLGVSANYKQEDLASALDIASDNQLDVRRGNFVHGATKLFNLAENTQVLEGEFGFILNCCLIRWHVDLGDITAIKEIAQSIHGAISIGLEISLKKYGLSEIKTYEKVSLKDIFKAGLWHLLELRRLSLRTHEKVELLDLNQPIAQLLNALTKEIPTVPDWWHDALDLNVLPVELYGTKPITSLSQIEALKTQLKQIPAL
jgi:hypothetical protein